MTLHRQAERAAAEVKTWPEWMQRTVAVCACGHTQEDHFEGITRRPLGCTKCACVAFDGESSP